MSMTRRTLLTGATGLAIAQRRRAPAAPPNVVLILADDLGAWMLGCYGNKEIRTPNIDLLARAGTRFVNHFVVTPICSASRATLFTGRTPRQHGIHCFLTDKPIEDPPQGQKAPPESFAREIMISDLLARRGYQCAYLGKWHMGNDENPGHGFTYTYTLGPGPRTYRDPVMYLNGQRVQEKGYLAELLTQKACEYIESRKPGEPFFLVIGYLNPHTPYEGHPEKYYEMYRDVRFETIGWEPAAPNALREKEYLQDIVGNIRRCAAAVTALDDQIPPLLAALDKRGLRDNTLVIFTADNGFLLGRHGLWSKGLASNPINMYEEVMAVPMIWNWPGKVPPMAARPELVSFLDFFPTLCEVTGVEPPADRNLCGRSYWLLASGRVREMKEPWRNLVFGHYRNTEMARDPRYKLILRDGGEGPGELYDLRQDPREKVNQYDNPEYVTVRDALRRRIEEWRQRCG